MRLLKLYITRNEYARKLVAQMRQPGNERWVDAQLHYMELRRELLMTYLYTINRRHANHGDGRCPNPTKLEGL